MNDFAARLGAAIENGTASVGVIGLGYVGLPLIDAFATSGFRTIGFDIDQKKVDRLLAGESYIGHISATRIAELTGSGQLIPTTDMTRLAEADVIVICVPTPLSESRDPDLRYVESTTVTISKHLRPGQLVVLESTTYPGTTRDVLLPILQSTGKVVGQDFFLAYSPEREDPGNPEFSARGIPKVVGGIDPVSQKMAEAIYEKAVVSIVPVSNPEIAEACKIVENTYRSVNIAMVNELKTLFDRLEIDIWEVIEAAKTKPFGYQAFYPGPGLGGHCIPIDPFYLSWVARKAGTSTRFIELAGEINRAMPRYVVDGVARALNQHGKPIRGSRICLLGVAYKKNVDDPRESPAFKLFELLSEAGATLSYNDPHVPKLPQMRSHTVPNLISQELTADYLASLDCALICTDHSAYDFSFIVKHAPLVIDTRNACHAVTAGREKIFKC
ncbi:MAG: nucleotide sugar dehydrogenase [Planctomycetota bacterium]|nr:nucleotide sugar dehydrogenase [Planctomycetota bacterium]